MPASDPRIVVEPRGPALLVTIDRPDARNAIDADMAWAIAASMDRLDADHDLRVGILAGAGGYFTAGADLKAAAAGGARALPDRGNFGICMRPPNKPVIAAIEGFALGGGFEMALACDLIVAARDAKLGLPEVLRGLVAAGGGAFRLARRMPYHLAVELALTGGYRAAPFFHGHGLVNRLAEPGHALAGAMELAAEISAAAPLAVAASLQIMRECEVLNDAEAWQAQDPILAAVRASDDRIEGLRAFAEKRAPQWSGR